MPIDDPAMQDAVSTYTRRGQRSRPADIAATLVLLIAHGFLFGATIVLLGLLVMETDPCGDPAWIDRAMRLGILGRRGHFDYRLCSRRISPGKAESGLFVPIIGCVAQIALGIGAAAMESLAGPVR